MKRLVICCDGTWNRADTLDEQGRPTPTNVIRLAYRIANHDKNGVAQIIYYDQGVGTGNWLDRLKGGLTGAGLEEHIFSAYRFLVANYEVGDEIFLFGFSRGAFTARSIAGLIRNSGILKRSRITHYKRALDLYLARNPDSAPDEKKAQEFRKENAVLEDTPIKFIGVWDTVGARGIPTKFLGLNKLTQSKYRFHDESLSSTIEYAYHALAIDEHRGPFEPTLWKGAPKPLKHDPSRTQTVEQVWFCGAHSDVGGGYEALGNKSLSDIALKWMLAKAEGAGLAFDEAIVRGFPLKDDCCATLHKSYKWGTKITRKIGKVPTEYVHKSALDRWESASPEYRPKALVKLDRMAKWLGIKPREDYQKV